MRGHGLLRENWYRDVWLVIITGFVVVALVQAQKAVERQAEGRQKAVLVTCSATSAVIDAGRATLLSGGTIKPRRFERNLERLGLPPRSARRDRAQTAAENYARFIAQRVAKETGEPGIVNKDGSLDCRRFQQVAKTRP